MGKFTTILFKEMKDLLRDPKIVVGMVLVPLVMFPALGLMFRTGIESVAEETGKGTGTGIIDLDGGSYAQAFIRALDEDPGVNLIELATPNVPDAIATAESRDMRVLMVIPKGFSEKIEHTQGAEIETYAIIRGMGISEIVSISKVDEIIQRVNRQLSLAMIEQEIPQADPEYVLNPITTHGQTVVKGTIIDIPPALIVDVMNSQSFIVPVILMMMILFVAQMAATSMATEKENKTLETLLTLPVSRMSILAGKMGGTAVVSVISAIAYIIGFSYYMSSFQPQNVSLKLADFGLSISPFGLGLLGISIFMAVLAALSLAMILAVFTQDVRSAQSLVSFTIMPLVFPALILMFADINTLPTALRIILLALPFSHPTIAARAVIMNNYGIVLAGIAYQAIFTLVVLYIAARMFSTERVVTAKISFRKKKKKPEQ
jgi:ABC-2 type transport system permease protein